MCPQQFHLHPDTVPKDSHQDWKCQSLKGLGDSLFFFFFFLEDSLLRHHTRDAPYAPTNSSNLDHRSCPNTPFFLPSDPSPAGIFFNGP